MSNLDKTCVNEKKTDIKYYNWYIYLFNTKCEQGETLLFSFKIII